MLRTLHIRNLAVIDQLEMEFDHGMTVLTGETGAGKSILIDSLGLVLGDRADSIMIRHGTEQADISAIFTVEPEGAIDRWLQEHDLAGDDNECHVRRTVAREGRSKAYINGSPVPVQMLRGLGEHLLDIHGQHAHQSLLKRPVQLQLLDAYAGHLALVRQVREAHQRWKALHDELEQIRRSGEQRAAQLELLRYQVRELTELELQEQELAALEQEHQRLSHTHQLLSVCRQTLEALDESAERPAVDQVSRLAQDLGQLKSYDRQLQPIAELLDGAVIQLQEAATELRHYLADLDTDPERLQWVEGRLTALYEMARKHRVQPAELYQHLQALQRELAALDVTEQRLNDAEAHLAQALDAYRELAAALSARRLKAAQTLSKEVTRTMRELGIAEGRFDIDLEKLDDGQIAEHGLERSEFQVAAGTRMPLRPLSKVASGGELSRISLAIQAITAQKDGAPTLIFDEVDVGIGGRVAEMVGHHLRELARYRQIICVTHLPQVAALTHHHCRVSKLTKRSVPTVRVEPLSEPERREEIARMLGGLEITEQTRAHAAEMLGRGRERA